jgi:hypothetical protein
VYRLGQGALAEESWVLRQAIERLVQAGQRHESFATRQRCLAEDEVESWA